MTELQLYRWYEDAASELGKYIDEWISREKSRTFRHPLKSKQILKKLKWQHKKNGI